MSSSRQELVEYRVERAHEALEDARVLADAERWNACVNRLFYSCFYAVSALLLRHDLSSSKHSGIRSLFNRRFVKTGLVSKELAVVFNDLFERRQESDYADLVRFQESEVRPWMSGAEEFVAQVASLIGREDTE